MTSMEKKIIFLISDIGQGGAERQAISICTHLRKAGYSVKLVYYGKNTFYQNAIFSTNETSEQIKSKTPFSRLFSIARVFHREHPQAVIAFMPTPIIYSLLVSPKWFKKYRLIISMRCAQDKVFRSKVGRIIRAFSHRADAIVCNSYSEKTLWAKYAHNSIDKVNTIYNLIDPGTVTQKTYIPLHNNQVHILIAARLMPVKNALRLLEALSLMEEEKRKKIQINWYGDLDGNVEYTDTVKGIIREKSLANSFKLHSPVENIFEIMATSDVVGLFSISEGLPNAICEGMILGKPVIMTKVSDYSQLVDETNGWLCDPLDAEDISYQLIDLSDVDIETLYKMGQSSKQKAHNLFSIESIVQGWMRIISYGK